MLDKTAIKSILVISLTNIGDIILTFPVIDILLQDFPDARMSVVIGPKGRELLAPHPTIDQVHLYVKRQGIRRTWEWFVNLQKTRYDLIVDLRNTALPFFLWPRYRTPLRMQRLNQHMHRQHLHRLKQIYTPEREPGERRALFISASDRDRVGQMLQSLPAAPTLVLAPGAADSGKRWPAERFAALAERLAARQQVNLIFIGDHNDRDIIAVIQRQLSKPGMDLSGRLNLPQLGCLLQRCSLLITNDTAPMHMASYLDRPVLALFGPTDPLKYGPWGRQGHTLERKATCPACQKIPEAGEHICLRALSVEDVLNTFEIKSGQVHFKTEKAECR